MPLTPQQQTFLDFIRSYQKKHGYAPTQKEIADHFGYRSFGTVQKYLVRLKAQGLLENIPHARRGLSIKTKAPIASASVSLPLLGRVAAGAPIEAVETTDRIDVPAMWVKKGQFFVLEVVGNSMIEDGILNGDFVIVKKQKVAEKGQMVVALVDNGATVKRFHPKNGYIELHPANSAYQPIRVNSEQSFAIEGVVTGVVRKIN